MVIVGSPNVNAGYKLVNNALYPQIASDYERMFRVLKSLPCDVFLGAHGDYYGMEAKYARMKEGGAESVHRSRGLQELYCRARANVSRGIGEADGRGPDRRRSCETIPLMDELFACKQDRRFL